MQPGDSCAVPAPTLSRGGDGRGGQLVLPFKVLRAPGLKPAFDQLIDYDRRSKRNKDDCGIERQPAESPQQRFHGEEHDLMEQIQRIRQFADPAVQRAVFGHSEEQGNGVQNQRQQQPMPQSALPGNAVVK